MTDRRETLQAFPFLAKVDPASREVFFAQTVRKSLSSHELLAADGRECAYLPMVLDGALRVYKVSKSGKELTLYRIERGESCILTATCILNRARFPALAEAERPSVVALVPSRLVVAFVEGHSEWRRFVFGLYARRLNDALTLVEEVAFQHVDSRTARYLLRHSMGQQRTVRRTHSQIASDLGTSREVITRILSDFQARGLVTTRRGSIRVLQAEALAQQAEASDGGPVDV